MNNHQYILIDDQPVAQPDFDAWVKWLSRADRTVARDLVGKVLVSTVFLAYDASYSEGAPILYETMIFGGAHDGYQRRYSTLEQAQRGHREAVLLVKPWLELMLGMPLSGWLSYFFIYLNFALVGLVIADVIVNGPRPTHCLVLGNVAIAWLLRRQMEGRHLVDLFLPRRGGYR